METAKERNGVGGILSAAFNAHLSHYAVGLSASDSSSGHCRLHCRTDNGLLPRKNEQEDDGDDLNLARQLTQI